MRKKKKQKVGQTNKKDKDKQKPQLQKVRREKNGKGPTEAKSVSYCRCGEQAARFTRKITHGGGEARIDRGEQKEPRTVVMRSRKGLNNIYKMCIYICFDRKRGSTEKKMNQERPQHTHTHEQTKKQKKSS
jgi:hypothetical protein